MRSHYKIGYRGGIIKRFATRFINLTTATLFFATTFAGAVPVLIKDTVFAAGNNIVTAGHSLGWSFTTTGDATSQYTTDPPVQISGNGSYELRSDSGKKGYLYDSSYASRDLTSLKHLSYSYYVTSRNAGTSVAPALSLITTINGTWTELKVEPTYTNGAPASSWQTIDAFAPTTKWYSTHNLQDVHGNTIVHKFNGVADLVSWDTLVELDHSARLGTDDDANGVRFTIGQNSGGAPWSNFDAYIDNININDNVYDFEPTSVPSVNAENFNTNSDSNYKGINVGFNISNFKTVSKVSVSLYKYNALLVTNIQNQNLLDLIASGTTEFSTPFIIQDGTYHEDYWNLGVHNWKSGDKPTKALISVTGTDGDGNTVTKTAENDNFVEPNGWTFDSLLPPSVPNTPTNLYFTQGTKTLSCNEVTNSIVAPTLHWTAPSGSLYQYVITPNYPDNQGEYQAYPAGSATSWWVTGNFANHGQGAYSYTIKAENTAGQWSTVATCGLLYDSVQPVIHILSPAPNSYVRGTATVKAEVVENGSGLKYVNAKFTDGPVADKEFGSVSLSLVPGTTDIYEGQINTTGHEGSYNITVNTADNANNTRSAKNQNVTIDNTAPTIAFVEPSADGTHHSGTLNVKVRATDNVALKQVTVHLYDDNGTLLSSGCASVTGNLGTPYDYTCSINTKSFKDGQYTLLAASEDNTTKVTTTSRIVIFDNTAPDIQINNAEVTGNPYYKLGQPINVHIIEGNLADTQTTATSRSSDNFWDEHDGHYFGMQWLRDGDYSMTSTDKAGNSTTITFRVDHTKPVISSTSHAGGTLSGSTLYNPTSFIINANDDASNNAHGDIQSGLASVVGNVYDANTGVLVVSHSTSSNSLTVDLSGLPDGGYYVLYNAHDAAGNVSNTNKFYFTVDHTAPTGTITYSNNNGNQLTNEGVTATLTTDEDVQDISGWTRSSTDSRVFTKVFADNGKFSVTLSDYAGNATTLKGEIKRIDRQAPQITGVVNGGVVNHPVQLTVFDPAYEGAFGFDANHGLTVNGSEVKTTEVAGHYFVTNTNITGDDDYTVVATDKAGNSTTIYFTIDTVAPAIPKNLSWLDSNKNPATNGFTNVQTGNLSWEDNDPTTNHYLYKFWTNIPEYYDGESSAWTTDDSKYFTGASIWTNFDNKEGTYYFCVEAVDVAGNASACSETYSVTYDGIAPNAPDASPVGGDFQSSPSVTLSANDNSGGSGLAGIYYTIDGSDPTTSATRQLYLSITPIVPSSSQPNGQTILKAVAYDNAGNASPVMTETYNVAPIITENSITPTTSSIVIVWTTDHAATSRVVYDTVSHSDAYVASHNSADNYGYAFSEDNGSDKTLDHSVTLTGLTPGQKYFFRLVSEGSPEAVSGEFNSVTLDKKATQQNGGTPTFRVASSSTTPTGNQSVLGAQTTTTPSHNSNNNTSDNNGQVKGDSTTKPNDKINNSGAFLGLGWWWLLIVAVVLGLWWLLAARRRADDDK